ncbi:MAG: hypothetical protein AAFW01_06505, partial [Pseudomonadota bacterium]
MAIAGTTPGTLGHAEDRAIRVTQTLESLDRDVYLHLVTTDLRILSVFDDTTYDRADADMLSPAMRQHAIAKLRRLGFRQKTGTLLVH